MSAKDTERKNPIHWKMRTLQGSSLLPAVARDHREGGEKWPHLPRLRSAWRVARDYCRSAYCVGLFFGLAVSAQAQAQDFGPGVTSAQQTLADLWTALQQTRALLATAQLQGAADTATIRALRTQLAGVQAQLASVPACPPVVVCPVCPAPVVCPVLPPPPPVVAPPPPAPAGAAALTWDPVSVATSYRVYFGTASGAYLQGLGQGIQTTLTTVTVGGLSPVRYFFAVTAVNAQGESGFSNEVFKDVSALPPIADTQPPSTPTGLAGVAVSPTQIALSWNPSTDNVGVAGYHVYDGVSGNFLGAPVTGTSFVHSGLVPGSTHSYRVSAFDAVPNHSPWFPATADPPVTVTTPLQ